MKLTKQISCKTCNNYNITLKSYIMKKTIITAVLLLTLLTTQAQQQFAGLWVCKESTCITTILASETKIEKVFSASFLEYLFLDETIVSESEDSFTTSIHNERNGWTVKMVYKYIDANTLSCDFTGDYNARVIMTRLKTNRLIQTKK